MSSKTLYVQHPVSLLVRIFPSLPGSRLQFFIAMQIQYSYEHTFVKRYAMLCAQPRVRNYLWGEREGLSTHTYTTGMFSKTLCARHPVTKDTPIPPRFLPTIFYRRADSALDSAQSVCSVQQTVYSPPARQWY